MIGSLNYNDYLKLYKSNSISSKNFDFNQIQPSSLDLSLSDECYEIKYSFLSQSQKLDKIKVILNKINLKGSLYLS